MSTVRSKNKQNNISGKTIRRRFYKSQTSVILQKLCRLNEIKWCNEVNYLRYSMNRNKKRPTGYRANSSILFIQKARWNKYTGS